MGGALEWPSLSSDRHTDSWRVIEQAKEELQILEAQHPNRFNYLKVELKSFIFAESQKLLSLRNTTTTTNNNINNNIVSTSSSVTTQASSSRGKKRKRKKGDCSEKVSKQKSQCWEDRVEAVLERAQACLRKIRDFKTNFL